jgi:hypothetical protein
VAWRRTPAQSGSLKGIGASVQRRLPACAHIDGHAITVEYYLGARHATAHEECRAPLEYKYAAYASWGLQDRTTQGSFEDFARDRFIIGDKGSVKE